MRRRRVVVVVAVLALAAAGAWWLSIDRLSAEEQQLVGTWLYGVGGGRNHRMVLAADRACRISRVDGDEGPGEPPLRWAARDGWLELDDDPSPLRRLLRPVAPRLGITVGQPVRMPLVAVSGGRFVLVVEALPAEDAGVVFTRAPAD